MDDESIDAENRADEITDWLNGLKVSVALRICRAYTKTMRKVIVQIMSRMMRMKKKTHEKDLMRIT